MVSRGIVVDVQTITLSDSGIDLPMDNDGLVDAWDQKAYARYLKRSTTNKKNTSSSSKAQNIQVKKYKVRVPLIHGIEGDASSVNNSELPWCTYCPLPGTQGTTLEKNDIVYVAIVDFKFEDLVILGCVSSIQQKSSSGASLDRIKYLSMANNAPARLSSNTQIGDITYQNLQALKGFTGPLNQHIWSLQNGGTGVNAVGEAGKKKVRDNFGIMSTVLMSADKFERLEKTNRLDSNTIYFIWGDDEED